MGCGHCDGDCATCETPEKKDGEVTEEEKPETEEAKPEDN